MTQAGTALVVGGSGALGSAIAERLSERGHAVVATFATAAPAHVPGGITWVRFAAPDDDPRAITSAIEGTGRELRTVVFAMGIPSSKQTLVDTPTEECLRLFAVNAVAMVTVWREIHQVARAGSARVLAISSQAAATLSPRNGPYSASKAALEAFALTLAKEEAEHGVRINVLAPSIIASPQAEHIIALKGEVDPHTYYEHLPWRRALNIAEAAETAVSLVDDDSWRYVSGQIFRLAADIPHQ